MKRIHLVLVLLVTVLLVSASVSVPTTFAGEIDVITAPGDDSRPGDLEIGTLSAAGDPTGMGTGNGAVDDDDPLLVQTEVNLEGPSSGFSAELLAYLLTLMPFLNF